VTRALVLCALLGCSGGKRPVVDANGFVDTPFQGACIGKIYDPCTDNSQCNQEQEEICVPLGQSGVSVCSLPCTAGNATTCRNDATGAAITCPARGVCEPTTPNNCSR
jgi:hypothetical protein